MDHIRNPVWGQLLRAKVAEAGLSMRAFAEKNGFTPRTFNSWCNGRWPGEAVARKVAAALNVDYAAMISDKPIGVDADTLETAIKVVDQHLREFNITHAGRAKLYSIAYQHLQTYRSPQALDRHVTDLLAIQSQLRP